MIGKAAACTIVAVMAAGALNKTSNQSTRSIVMPAAIEASPPTQVRDDSECISYAKAQEIDLQLLAIPGVDHSAARAQYNSFERLKKMSGC